VRRLPDTPTQSETPYHWDRPSRRLHRPARSAPPIPGASHTSCSPGKRRDGLGRPIPGRLRSSSVASFQTLALPGSRRSASAIAQAGAVLRPAPARQTTPYRHRAQISARASCFALPPASLQSTPHPPQGGFERPSNITRDYAPSVLLVRRAAGRPARPTPARPHNRRYVKCPRRYRSKRCARLWHPASPYLLHPCSRVHVGPCVFAAARGPKGGPCSFAEAARPFGLPARPGVSARQTAAAIASCAGAGRCHPQDTGAGGKQAFLHRLPG
jgi:hypothetical protein